MYQRFNLDLTNISAGDNLIVPDGKTIAEIFVLSVPTGAIFDLRIGSNTDYVTVPAPFTMEPQGEQESNNGLRWRNTVAQAGVIIALYVVYGGAQLNPVLT